MKASARRMAVFACLVWLSSAGVRAQSTQACTNATLTGTYAYLLQGSLVSQGSLVPYADMGSLTADGKGNFSGSGTESFAGTIESGTAITGTYVVNTDCTASTSLTYTNGIGTFHYNLLVLNNGTSFTLVQTDNGFSVFGAAHPQPSNCALASLNGSYAFSFNGSFVDTTGSLNTFADAGKMTFNGTGGLSISDTASENGQVTPNRSISGSYATHSDCTGTFTYTDPTLGAALHTNLAIIDEGKGIRFIDSDSSIIIAGTATNLGDIAVIGTMAHVASGGGWLTTFTLSNTGTVPANIQLSFFGDNGEPLSLPLLFLDSNNTMTSSSLTETISAGATLVIATHADSSAALVTGSAQLTTTGGNVNGFAVFHYNPNGQEAVVPIQTQNAAAYVLAFDNTNGLSTGLAIANVSNQAVKVPMIARDDAGAQLGTATISLPAHGHISFTLPLTYGFVKGKRGTVEFDTPSNAQISALAIRGAPSGSFTTIPVLLK